MLENNAQAVKYIKAETLKRANSNIKNINNQIKRDFGLVGPLSLSIPSDRVHAIRWATARESFIVETNVKRVTKEAVASAVAQLNNCPYCEDAHVGSISGAGEDEIAEAISDGTWESLRDTKLKEIIRWSLNTRNPEHDIIKNPPFPAKEAPEIIGTALTFHSTNRLVSIYLEESPMPAMLTNKLIKKTALSIASKTLFKSMVVKDEPILPDESLKFIDNVPVTGDLNWAKYIPAYAKALSAKNTLLLKIEKEIIPVKSAQLLKNKIKDWHGEEMPLGRSWLTENLNGLSETEKPVARLMFLAAFAPYSIVEKDINDFRKIKSSDKELIEVCFWSIQMITNRISEWLTKSFK